MCMFKGFFKTQTDIRKETILTCFPPFFEFNFKTFPRLIPSRRHYRGFFNHHVRPPTAFGVILRVCKCAGMYLMRYSGPCCVERRS